MLLDQSIATWAHGLVPDHNPDGDSSARSNRRLTVVSWTFPSKYRIWPGNVAELSTDKTEKCSPPKPGLETWIQKSLIQCAIHSAIGPMIFLVDVMSTKLSNFKLS